MSLDTLDRFEKHAERRWVGLIRVWRIWPEVLGVLMRVCPDSPGRCSVCGALRDHYNDCPWPALEKRMDEVMR